MRTSLALAAAGLLLIATPAFADTRSDRDRTTPATAPAPVVVVPTPTHSPITTPSHNSGSISSNTSVSTNSGGNSGGSVTTGNQTSVITVVNVGPTSNNTQVINPAPPAPAPQCTGRDCPRTR